MKTQLQIVKRGESFVVQIRRQNFFTKKWYWKDMSRHISETQRALVTKNGPPTPKTAFATQGEAEAYCYDILKIEATMAQAKESVVMTYNTGLHDAFWGDPPKVPECKPKTQDINKCGWGCSCFNAAGSIKTSGEKMKELIINAVSDLVSSFLYYDRKEDEDLPRDEIEKAIKNGIITVDEVCARFRDALIEGVAG